MSLLVPYAGCPSIIVSWSFRSGQEGFDIYKYEYICFPCAFRLVSIFEFGPFFLFVLTCFLMISAREETWRYLSDGFPSLCFIFFICCCVFSFCIVFSSERSASTRLF
ncbi:hypothetical protein ACN42_g9705 [Penicillium freii]|uniref:Uncharacterized protein n=1 Tax=Penicillium freii TaxID=48697 RepID=A0A101MBE0_PENFR|nr:hypothetical protein ACN42_g9705 [Penicillium freii]